MAFPAVKKAAETLRIYAFCGEVALPAPELFDQPLIDLNSAAPPLSYEEWEQWMEINKLFERSKKKKRRVGKMIDLQDCSRSGICFARSGNGGGRRTGGGGPGRRRPAASSYLVAAGCYGCRYYLMVDKGAKECPLCKGEIITFERKAAGG